MWKYVLAWFPMVAIAIANGGLRRAWYGKHLGELQAHQVSTLTAILLFGVYIGFVVHLWRLESAKQAVTIGLVWLAMTVTFEFLFWICVGILIGWNLLQPAWVKSLRDKVVAAINGTRKLRGRLNLR